MSVVYGLEDVGGYGRALAVYLTEKGCWVKEVNAKLANNRRKSHVTVQKSDAWDAECIAKVLKDELPKLPDAKMIYSDPSGHRQEWGTGGIGGSTPKSTWVKAGEGVYTSVDWYTGGALTDYINSNDQPWSAEHLLNAANLAINFIPISAAEAKALQIGKTAEKAGVSLIQKAGQWIKVVFKGEVNVAKAVPKLESLASSALSSKRPIIGIIRENGQIDAFVQPENYGVFLSHERLGLTKEDLGFSLSYNDGKWSIQGSGYAAGKNWAQPTPEQGEMIKKMFGVGG